ncbi:MAG: ExeA family protein, partial [Planctomycetia bacterium]
MYEAYFELKRRPFAGGPETSSYHRTTQHERALQAVRAALRDGDAFAVVLGDPGTGKTLVARLVLESLPEDAGAVLLANCRAANVAGLLKSILFELDVAAATDDAVSLRLQLTELLTERFRHNGRTVLVVDEAQHLDAAQLEELRLLTNLEGQSRRAVQV